VNFNTKHFVGVSNEETTFCEVFLEKN